LQVDGYGAYAQLAQHGDVALAFCWSHVRRQFYQIQVKTPAPIATQAPVRIAELYAIEADIRVPRAPAGSFRKPPHSARG
jgi:hypothetical protein